MAFKKGEAHSRMVAESNRKRAQKPGYKEQINRQQMRRLWDETPDKLRPMHRWQSGNMTRIEKVVWSIVEPYGFKFEPHYYRVEDTFLLPDFVCGDLVIEVQGEYWHTQEQTAERERLLNLLGMKVLFVWGEELNM